MVSRTIAVRDFDGNDEYIVAKITPVHHLPFFRSKVDFPGTVSFYLSTGQVMNHVSVSEQLFENPITEETYYIVNDEDVEWLLSIHPTSDGKIGK